MPDIRTTVDPAQFQAAATTTSAATAVPTLVTHGVEAPANRSESKVQIAVVVARSAGTVATHVELYGWAGSTIGWLLLEDLTGGARTDTAAVKLGYQCEVGRAYTRYQTRQATTLGGTGSVTTYIGFS
jgi:hypothetical protein